MQIIIPVLLFLIFCADLFSSFAILPLFPTIAAKLHVTRVELHQSIAFITFGIFSSQLLVGINILVIGYRNAFIMLFIILGIGCLLSLNASNIHIFFLGEFLQGFGLGASYPVIQGVVNIFDKKNANRTLSYFGSIPMIFIFLGPMIGSQFQNDWHHVFYVLLGASICMLMMSFFIPNHSENEQVSSSFFKSSSILIKNKAYLSYVFIRAVAYIGFYFFLAWIPFLVIEDLHLTHTSFSHRMIFPTLALFAGGLSSSLFGERHRASMYTSGLLFIVAGTSLFIFYFLNIFNVWSVFLSCSLFSLGFGLISVQISLSIFSVINQNLSGHAMIFSSLVVNFFITVTLFILAYFAIDEGLVMGSVFLITGLITVFIMLLPLGPVTATSDI